MKPKLQLFLVSFSVMISHPATAADPVDFARDVAPILSDRCFHCHGPDAENQESSFRADTQEGLLEDLGGYFAVVPGDPEESELFLRITSTDESDVMPPPDSHRYLSDKEKQTLERWIREGAVYEGHWAFERVERPAVPEQASHADWATNPIDAFVGKQLADEGLEPSPRAEPATLLRRVSLTLTGLLPSRELQDQFVKNPTKQAYCRAVDELLASQHFAERQSLRWLDAARYADTDGYQNDSERTNWPWRDWVTKAFHENMPFDQFTIEQLAGDMLPDANDSQRLASAFNRNHRQNAEAGALDEEFLVENIIDRVETTSTVWLGLTMGCARCHDHKYDPLSQREFYQLYAYFNNIGEKGTGRGRYANPTMKAFSPFANLPEDLLKDYLAAEDRLNKANRGLEKRFAKWLAKFASAESSDENAASSPSEPEPSPADQIDEEPNAKLATAFEELDEEVREILNKPAASRSDGEKGHLRNHFKTIDPDYIAANIPFQSAESAIFAEAGPRVSVMIMRERDGDPQPAYLLQRGQYNAPDESTELPRAVPAILMNDETSPSPTNRLQLARWLVSRDNPLTARVIVNRIWQDHFGVGLVKTSEDFGVQGDPPSHPDLLDWLAAEFMESGWDMKALHRLIVTSQTYCQRSHVSDTLYQRDPQNRLLARGPRYRADGFVIRDVALQVGDLLNQELGGPPVKPYQPNGLWETLAAKVDTRYEPSQGDSLYRKSLYTYWKRAVNPPRQTIFDSGGREVCDVRIRRTNTPLQSLVLMNDPTMIEAARHLAQRVLLEAGDETAQLNAAYHYALARQPTGATLDVLRRSLAFFQEHFAENPEEAQQWLSVGASPRDESLNTVQHAAMTGVAHLVMNLDEFITIE